MTDYPRGDMLHADRLYGNNLWADSPPRLDAVGYRLRRATLDDVPAIVDMRSQTTAHLSTMPESNEQWRAGTFYDGAADPAFSDTVRDSIHRGETFMLVRRGEALATLAIAHTGEEFLWPSDPSGSTFYVSRLMRRGFGSPKFAGAGEAALRGVEDIALTLGMQAVRLTTWTGNDSLAEYYRGQGYQSVDGPNFAAYPAAHLMEKKISYHNYRDFAPDTLLSLTQILDERAGSSYSPSETMRNMHRWRQGGSVLEDIFYLPSAIQNLFYDREGNPQSRGLSDYMTSDEHNRLVKEFGHTPLFCRVKDGQLSFVRPPRPISSARELRSAVEYGGHYGKFALYNPGRRLHFLGRIIPNPKAPRVSGESLTDLLLSDQSALRWATSLAVRTYELHENGMRSPTTLNREDKGRLCHAMLTFSLHDQYKSLIFTGAQGEITLLPPE